MDNKQNKKGWKGRLPTILGILLLVVGVGTGVYLASSDTGFIPRAAPEYAPKSLVVTNITENSFTISWVTDEKTVGFLKYGIEENKLKDIVNDDRDQLTGSTDTYRTHHVTIKNLEPETDYFFKIASGGKNQFYDNNGQPYKVSTASVLGTPPTPDSAYGEVMTSASTPADGAIVYISLPDAGRLSTLVNDGQWALSLSTARTNSLNSYVNYDPESTNYDVLIKNGVNEESKIIANTGSDQPMASVTLGQDYDFSSQAESVEPESASESAVLNESKREEVDETTESGFNLDPLGAVTEATEELTILNPSVDDEGINSSRPEFMGTAPAGTEITIEVNSENEYVDTVIVNENNTWSWAPPDDLEPGEHTVTVSFTDENGILQTLTKSFVVYAAEGSSDPAFTATPSATPKPTPTPITTPKPTLTPTPTPISRVSYPASSSGVPESGTVENTLAMLGIGLMMLGLGGYLYSRNSFEV